MVRNRRGPLGYENCAWGTESRLWTSHHWQFRACMPITPMSGGLEPVCLKAAEQRSHKSSSTRTRQLQLSVLCNQVNRGVEADKRSFQPQCLHVLPSCVMETPRSILGAIQKGQWLTSLDLKDPYFHIIIHPANGNSLRFCQNGTTWQFTVLSYGLLISPRVFTKILKPVLACAKNTHLHGSSYIYVTGRLKESSSLNSFKYRLKKSLFPTRSKTHDNDTALPL